MAQNLAVMSVVAAGGDEHGAVLLFGQRLHGEGDRRDRQVGDRRDALDVEPAPRDARRDIGLVEGVGVDDLDLCAPRTSPPKSCAAISAAAAEPGPPESTKGPDSSVSTPILSGGDVGAGGEGGERQPECERGGL